MVVVFACLLAPCALLKVVLSMSTEEFSPQPRTTTPWVGKSKAWQKVCLYSACCSAFFGILLLPADHVPLPPPPSLRQQDLSRVLDRSTVQLVGFGWHTQRSCPSAQEPGAGAWLRLAPRGLRRVWTAALGLTYTHDSNCSAGRCV